MDEKKRYVCDPQEDLYDSIRMEKNTWGAVNVRVETNESLSRASSVSMLLTSRLLRKSLTRISR